MGMPVPSYYDDYHTFHMKSTELEDFGVSVTCLAG
jgi:hypothetical protein